MYLASSEDVVMLLIIIGAWPMRICLSGNSIVALINKLIACLVPLDLRLNFILLQTTASASCMRIPDLLLLSRSRAGKGTHAVAMP